ncbi:hypothetical protein GJ990_08560 [Campylobacter jejuni]|nr:hypothetical protein [Campylobacter jejuni]EDP3108919.1 hypothetical protein [Campylobacter jejuni]EDP3314672.1 hypothetical protein [Campylobacter jejuni]EDP4177421.1 hypothetical protein [Campylobacter jejuni]
MKQEYNKNPIYRVLYLFIGFYRFVRTAVISISHDRKYIEEVCDKIYQLNPNGLQLIGD